MALQFISHTTSFHENGTKRESITLDKPIINADVCLKGIYAHHHSTDSADFARSIVQIHDVKFEGQTVSFDVIFNMSDEDHEQMLGDITVLIIAEV